jgi:hypothetical protein
VPGLFSYIYLLYGADTQLVRILVIADDLCAFLVSQASRRALAVLLYIYSIVQTLSLYVILYLQLTCAFF